jgi:hypothetical protein
VADSNLKGWRKNMKVETLYSPVVIRLEEIEEVKALVAACFMSDNPGILALGKQLNSTLPKKIGKPCPHTKDRRSVTVSSEVLEFLKKNPDVGYFSKDIQKNLQNRKMQTVHSVLSYLYFGQRVLRDLDESGKFVYRHKA